MEISEIRDFASHRDDIPKGVCYVCWDAGWRDGSCHYYDDSEPVDIDAWGWSTRDLSIFCDGCGRALVTGQNCNECEMSMLYEVTRSCVRVAFWLALATIVGLSTALLYAWINPHA